MKSNNTQRERERERERQVDFQLSFFLSYSSVVKLNFTLNVEYSELNSLFSSKFVDECDQITGDGNYIQYVENRQPAVHYTREVNAIGSTCFITAIWFQCCVDMLSWKGLRHV